MLTGKNVVIVKGEKGTLPIMKDYDRVYLEFASTDKLEEYQKTTEGKDLLNPDGSIWKGLKPAEDKTASKDVGALVTEACNFLKDKYPGTAENPNDGWLLLLEAASYGQDLWERNAIQAGLRPSKPIDKNAAIAKMVKLLKSLNPKMSDAKALAVATAATEDDSEAVAA